MNRQTDESSVSSSERRLVLGFDAGCMTCSGLAKRIKEQVSDKLEVRSLHDTHVKDWREQALGEEAPWAPTLIEIESGKVRAWTGWRMGVHLNRSIGFPATWQVMQVLGEFDVAPLAEGSVGRIAGGLSRGQFLKGAGGALVAMSILFGASPLTRSAFAKEWVHPLERVEFETSEKLRGKAKQEALRTAVGSQDVQNVRSARTSSPSEAFAVRHTLADGNTLTAVSWPVDENKVVVHYVTARPIGNYRSQAMLLTAVPDKEVVKTAESVNGKQRNTNARMNASQAQRSLQASGCACCRWNWSCVATVAAGCVGCGGTCATCVATPAKWACAGCLSCAFVGCPVGIRMCCRRHC